MKTTILLFAAAALLLAGAGCASSQKSAPGDSWIQGDTGTNVSSHDVSRVRPGPPPMQPRNPGPPL